MDIGYFGFNNGPLGTPDAMRRILGALDTCGVVGGLPCPK